MAAWATGGPRGKGTVFELSPSGGGWTKTILYNFTGESDGQNPGAVLVGYDGNLYGLADGGANGNGVIFQLARSGNAWVENVIVAFQDSNYGFVSPNLVQDSSGNFYGVRETYRTDRYGWYIDGTVYELSQINGSWTITELYAIAPETYDSYAYVYGLAWDGKDALYEATYSFCIDCWPQWLSNKIYYGTGPRAFLGQDFGVGGMTADAQRNLYGASNCGRYYQGTVWEVTF